MDETPDTLVAACQVAGLVAAALLLPSVLVDQVFGTDVLSVMLPTSLAAFAVGLIVKVWKAQEPR